MWTLSMRGLIRDKQTFLGCFNRVFFKMFVCLSSFTSLSNGKLELIGILLTFVWDFNSSTVLSFAECLLIFGTESFPVVSELNQTLFKYFNKFFAKQLLPLWFKCSFFIPYKSCYVSIIYITNIFLTTIIL